MLQPIYHEAPALLSLETEVLDSRPGRVRLARSPFYPGGGGQLADRGVIRWSDGESAITGFEETGGRLWILLDSDAEPSGVVEAKVDVGFRRMMTELHTGTHILNALVFRRYAGALVTGAQMNDDGTARMDFDLPDADNAALRALEHELNDAIRQDLEIRTCHLPMREAREEPGLLRSKSVTPPPTPDGKVRIVEIVGLDRQACGGTHLPSTGDSPPLRILKVDNKGRHNRRIKIGRVTEGGGA